MATLVVFVLLGVYIGFIQWASLAGDRRIERRLSGARERTGTSNPGDITVVVPARNESRHVGGCVLALKNLDTDGFDAHFILVDDGSTDGTWSVMQDVVADDNRFTILRHEPGRGPDSLIGKSAALDVGIRASRSELVATTDADCRPPRRWLAELRAQFADRSLGLVCGVTVVRGEALWSRLQALDWMLLLGTTAHLSELGLPLTGMGNNMAFRRAAYEAIGGYAALPFSVTEDYALFRAVARVPGLRAELRLRRDLKNVTVPVSGVSGVVGQRKRWTRGGLQSGPQVYALFLLLMLANVGLLALLPWQPLLGLTAVTIKILSDGLALRRVARRLGEPLRWLDLPAYVAFQAGYCVAIPLSLALRPRIRWKERVY